MIRIGTFKPNEVLPYITDVTGETEREYLGHMVKMGSLRYQTFAKSLTCVQCGLKSKFFALEQHGHTHPRYHFNLYGHDGNKEILFTKDHIIPKSRGGKLHISNMQTMCTICNNVKGNKLRFTIVQNDNWEGIYDESGKLIAEGKILLVRDILDALGHDVISKRVSNKYIRSLPMKIEQFGDTDG